MSSRGKRAATATPSDTPASKGLKAKAAASPSSSSVASSNAHPNFDFDNAAMEEFKALLNVDPNADSLKKPSDFAERFQQIAHVLLNEAVVYVNQVPYRLTEIEFYYQAPRHPDYFTHCDPQQKTNSQWYLHRTGKAYRSGTFKGIDITFGCDKAFGGILVRSMKSLVNSTALEGPCVCVDAIMAAVKAEKVQDLATLLEENKLSIFPPDDEAKRHKAVLYVAFPKNEPTRVSQSSAKLAAAAVGSSSITSFFGASSSSSSSSSASTSPVKEAKEKAEASPIHQSPRVGLTLKKSSGGNHKNPLADAGADGISSAQEEWLMKPYRFMTGINKMRKGKHYIIVALHHDYGFTEDKVVSLSGSPVATVKKFIQLFEEGKKLSIQKFVDVKLTPEEVCQLWGAIVAANKYN